MDKRADAAELSLNYCSGRIEDGFLSDNLQRKTAFDAFAVSSQTFFILDFACEI